MSAIASLGAIMSVGAITSVGEWYAGYERDTEGGLVDLGAELKRASRQPVRRIDRFIQLAMIGSARCVGERTLPATTGIYLASGCGPISSNAAVQQQMFSDGLIPKPAHFINTLANTAGFYVARNLGLEGQCLFVSRGYAAFEAALELALTDLAQGYLPAALVGCVDECTLPLEQHAQRMHRTDAQRYAEGSVWLLLEPGSAAQSGVEEVASLNGGPALQAWLQAQPSDAWLWQAPTLDAEAVGLLQRHAQHSGWRLWQGPAEESPLAAAVAAIRFLSTGAPGTLISVNTDRAGWYQVCRYRVGA